MARKKLPGSHCPSYPRYCTKSSLGCLVLRGERHCRHAKGLRGAQSAVWLFRAILSWVHGVHAGVFEGGLVRELLAIFSFCSHRLKAIDD